MKPEPKMTAAHIDGLLHERHGTEVWVYLSELRNETGFASNQRTIDGFALHTYPSQFEAIAYEIKVSRADFQRDLQDVTKRRPFVEASTSFYYVTPVGLVKPHEVPEECGLMEARPGSLLVIKPAPCRTLTSFPHLFVAAMLRRRGQAYVGERVFKFADREMTLSELQALLDERTKKEREAIAYEVDNRARQLALERVDEELVRLREVEAVIRRIQYDIGLEWDWTPENLRDRLAKLKSAAEAASLADRLESIAATLRAPVTADA